MLVLTQEQFENYIKKIIKGELSKKQLAKNIGISERTLNEKIGELTTLNPNLYYEFIKKVPYKAKQIEDIDYEALAIYILKNETTLERASEKFGISIRTISRNIKELKNTNPELKNLYEECSKNRKISRPNTLEQQEKINRLVEKEIKIPNMLQQRVNKLRKIRDVYEEKCKECSTNSEAATSIGFRYDVLLQMMRDLQLLEKRIEAQSMKEKLEQDKQKQPKEDEHELSEHEER